MEPNQRKFIGDVIQARQLGDSICDLQSLALYVQRKYAHVASDVVLDLRKPYLREDVFDRTIEALDELIENARQVRGKLAEYKNDNFNRKWL